MGNRPGGQFKVILWWAWLIAIAVIAAGPFLWEVEYFRRHGNLIYFRAIVGLLLLLVPVCFFYVRWRRGGWYRYELPVIAGCAICLAAVEQPRGFVVGLLFFLACITAGQSLARLFAITFKSAAETIGIGFSLGSAALIPVLFVLGLAHAYYWPVFLLLFLLPLVVCRRDAIQGVRAIGRLWRAAGKIPALAHPLCGVAVIFLAAGVLCGTVAALAPSLVMDALKMHLPSAQTYVAVHALQPVLDLAYSYYPQGFEVLLATAYALGAQPAAQMITPIFFVALLLVLFEIAKLCEFDSAAVLIGVAALLMTPFLLWDGTQMKNDLELALFQIAALYCCLRWRASAERAWLMLGAILLASSFSIKHTAAIGAVPLALLFVAPLYRKPRGVRTAAMFFLCVAVVGFYWHARTFLMTGDPLYPRDWEQAVTPKKARFSPGGRVLRRLEAPWLIQFQDSRLGFESPLRSPMGIMLLTCAPLALLAPRRRNHNRMAGWFYIAVYLLLWGSRLSVLRYALPAIALLTLFVAAKVKEAYDQHWALAPGPMRFSIAAALAGTLAYGLLGAILVEIVPGQLPLLAGRINGATYLRSNLPGYAALESFARASPHAAVFAVTACGRAYAPNPVTSSCASGALNAEGLRHLETRLNTNEFQFVLLPAYWDGDARATLFSGWKSEEVYADLDWRGFQITRNP
jgi:hypothetical protein